MNLLIQLCGLPLFVLTLTISGVLTLGAIWLTFRTGKSSLLSAFLPLCASPFFVMLAASLFGLLASIDVQLDAEEDSLRDPAFLLTMNLVPIVFGAVAASVPALVTMIGCWALALSESGVRLLPERSQEDNVSKGFDPEGWVDQDAEDYLEQLTRPR